jgi:arginyl-tRNA synthetase
LSSFCLWREAREAVEAAIRAAVSECFGIELPEVVLEKPPRPELGDLATTAAFDLARSLKRAPRSIAQELAPKIPLPPGVAAIHVEGGGYLNFDLDRGRFVRAFFERLETPRAAPARPGKVIVEHTNINPNKAAHIGHLRNAILGDTLVRCLRHSGRQVEVQNYIDDTGVQVADVVVGFLDFEEWTLERLEEQLRERRFARGGRDYACFGDLCWDVYAEVGRTYRDRPETQGLRAETLHAIEEGGNLRAAAAELVASAIVAEHMATMGRLGVAYDLLPRESDILRRHFWTQAFALLKERGAVAFEAEGKHAGCWVMKLSETEAFAGMDEPDKILVRSNGTVTYTGKDIAYQLWKFGRLGLDFDYAPFVPDWTSAREAADAVPEEVRGHAVWQTAPAPSGDHPPFGRGQDVYNVIDVRQSYPQKVVREGLRLLGFEAEAEASHHFAYEMVALTPGTVRRLSEEFGDEYRLSPEDEKKAFVEMSGRKGQGVKALDLLYAMEVEARKRVVVREAESPVPDEARGARARQIAVGALRYFMLKFGRNKIIAFDFEEALNFEGDTGPYLQYSAVRADNIFRKLEARGLPSTIGPSSYERLESAPWEDDLWQFFAEVSRTDDVVDRAIESLEIGLVARHAFSLAQAFSQFYHRHPILNEADHAVRERRLAAARAFREGLRVLFSLLGIPAPEQM